ncbi:protein associated with mitochondrial ATP synthase [Scheffersomyces xylosifermentans]|uniref:protein associated with mitochondrial ATP synthase n=1 Tax=Scheffersomyces xylosifermentans TaxID=1304137 RepID=UPI00315DDFC6
MSAIISKATGLINSAVSKSTELANCAVYWTKVSAEVTKVVVKNEGLAPPSSAQFQTFYQNAFKFIQSPEQQRAFLEKAAVFRPGKQCAVKAAVYGTQLLAFFSVGEIIGRRHVFGYPSVGGSHH